MSAKSGLLPENYKFLEFETFFYNFTSKLARGEILFEPNFDFFFYYEGNAKLAIDKELLWPRTKGGKFLVGEFYFFTISNY